MIINSIVLFVSTNICLISFSVAQPIEYKYVKVERQFWMKENLNVSSFSNGDIIPHAKNMDAWVLAGKNEQPAWCYYENTPSNETSYGKLYNWYAVNDPRGLSPEGWHVPSKEEWEIVSKLINSDKKKEMLINTMNFFSNIGYREKDASFRSSEYPIWWSSTEGSKKLSWLSYLAGIVSIGFNSKDCGFSVRCIRNLNNVEDLIGINPDGTLVKDTSKIRSKIGKLFTGLIINNCKDEGQWSMNVINGIREGSYVEYFCYSNNINEVKVDTPIFEPLSSEINYDRLPNELNPINYEKPDQNVRMKCFYKNNKFEGSCRKYNPNGAIEEVLNYKNGKLNGRCYYFNAYSPFFTDYVNGVKQGEEIKYNSDGKISDRYSYVNNKITESEIYTYYDDGNYSKKTKKTVSNIEIHESLNSDGYRQTQTYKNGKIEGPVIEYYENGNIKSKYNYTVTKSGNSEFNGWHLSYFESGKIKSKTNFSYGKIIGISFTYYEDGTLHSTIPFVNGKAHGIGFSYHENGKISEKCTWKNGELDGPYYMYNVFGSLESVYYYHKGVKIE
jgi:uncharacterized protein (TIGR02145 family)